MSSRDASGPGEITVLLHRWNDGDESVLDELWPLVYSELHAIAARKLAAEDDPGDMQATVIVHEAFFRLRNANAVRYSHRNHFYAVAAKVMRRVLVDEARAAGRLKRGGGWFQVPYSEVDELAAHFRSDLPGLDDALDAFEIIDPTKVRVVELKFFAGLSNREVGETLGFSERTVKRHWVIAQMWLYREIFGLPGQTPGEAAAH